MQVRHWIRQNPTGPVGVCHNRPGFIPITERCHFGLTEYVRDRQRLEQSLERIMAWDFQRIVMAHGAVVEQNAAQVIAQTRRALLGA